MNHICSSIFKKQEFFLQQRNQILLKGRPKTGKIPKWTIQETDLLSSKIYLVNQFLITNHFNLYFRLTNWQIVQNVIVTYLGYQDIMKDVFLFAKLILSLKVATIVSDPCVCHDFATIVSFFLKIILVFNWITQELMIWEKQEINQG